jgi:hypothetical protein
MQGMQVGIAIPTYSACATQAPEVKHLPNVFSGIRALRKTDIYFAQSPLVYLAREKYSNGDMSVRDGLNF